ncbi:ATP-binding protein [Thermodesulfovibrio hydrogeniphilus]
MINDLIDKLEVISERLKKFVPSKIRLYFKDINIEKSRGALVYGLRGVGKTTFLLHKIASQNLNFLYFSADHPAVSPYPLYDLVSAIFNRGYDGVVIDEVHHANNWSIHVKALYDEYPDKYIWISDSSNILLRKATADLSRRFVQYRIPLMSFREYIHFETGVEIEKINPFEPEDSIFEKTKNLNILKLFRDYLHSGTRPFYLEGNYCERLKALVEKSLFYDIPFYVPSVSENHLRVILAIVGTLINSPIPLINISGMCSEWGIGKEKLYNILETMAQCEILNIVKKQGKHVYTKGAKIFLSDPSVYICYDRNLGNVREAFAVMCFKEKYQVFACKDDEECDFLVEGFTVEIGSKDKKPKKADFIFSDEIDVPVKNRKPLWILGLGW